MRKLSIRAEAKSVIRGELRHRGYEPTSTTPDTVIRVMDDLARGTGNVAAYYLGASDRAIGRFAREIASGKR